jgi:CBS domain containing-hemolysin-like protein
LVAAFKLNDFEILLISTALLLLFGELIPKYLARELADNLIMIAVIPIRFVTLLLFPIVKFTSGLSELLTRTSKKMDREEMHHLFNREDIQSLIDESTRAGKVGETESEIINKIIELREQKVYEAMTPRTEIIGVELDSSISDVLNVFIDSGYSKLPVYEENLDKIKGLVIAYDMFINPSDLQSIIRDVIFVPETKKSLEMLNELLEKQISVAIVVDEFGGTAGLVTVEDLIEEMFGEIKDEYDVEDEICKKIDGLTYVLSGKVEIDYLNEEYELNLPEGDYETIGGLITNFTGKIPTKGEIIKIDDFNFLIIRSDKTKVDLVKLTIKPEYSET